MCCNLLSLFRLLFSPQRLFSLPQLYWQDVSRGLQGLALKSSGRECFLAERWVWDGSLKILLTWTQPEESVKIIKSLSRESGLVSKTASQFSVVQAENYLLLHILTPVEYCIILSLTNLPFGMCIKKFMPMALLYFLTLSFSLRESSSLIQQTGRLNQ